jgi:hypothetical protein
MTNDQIPMTNECNLNIFIGHWCLVILLRILCVLRGKPVFFSVAPCYARERRIARYSVSARSNGMLVSRGT